MKLPKELTTVTPLSKFLAIILFITLPFVGFLIGTRYQQMLSSQPEITSYPTPTPKPGCYYAKNPEAACPMKDCGKILICPTPATDETADWKTYVNSSLDISFKYPTDFEIVKESPQEVEFGGSFIDLTISTINLSNYKSTKLCSQIVGDEQLPCIDDYKGWNQKEPITKTKLDNIDAVSYYLQGRPDYAYHVVQTTTQPIIELKMSVAGGGLDDTFDQILSTFKFTQ